MLKRISILLATLVTVIGTTIGFISPANATTSLPGYGPPVNVAHTLMVQQAPEVVYVVKSGDSLSAIASKFHLHNWEKLYCKNRKVIGNKPWLIQPDMRLTIKETKKLCDVPVQEIIKAPVVMATIQHKERAQVQTLSTTGRYLGSGSFQQCVIQRESGGNPTAYNPSSGASGLYGMLLSTWDSLGLGYPGGAYTAPVSVQNEGFYILYARDGTSPWAPYDGC